MADKTGIEWTDATKIIDRDDRRVRIYKRKTVHRPGQQIRRQMLAVGMKWCRVCQSWQDESNVTKNGLCKQHEREDYRRRYAASPEPIRQRVQARKRGVAPVPQEALLIAELFDNKCAYCGGKHEAWDHVHPVKLGGQTVAGNIVPACVSCNSSKKAKPLSEWLDRGGMVTERMVEYMFSIHQGF